MPPCWKTLRKHRTDSGHFHSASPRTPGTPVSLTTLTMCPLLLGKIRPHFSARPLRTWRVLPSAKATQVACCTNPCRGVGIAHQADRGYFLRAMHTGAGKALARPTQRAEKPRYRPHPTNDGMSAAIQRRQSQENKESENKEGIHPAWLPLLS
jgi:hypothetical protein